MPAIEVHSAPITIGAPLCSPSLLQSGQKKNQEASWLSRSVSAVTTVFCNIGRATAYTAKALYDFLIFVAVTPYKYIYHCLTSVFNDKKQHDGTAITTSPSPSDQKQFDAITIISAQALSREPVPKTIPSVFPTQQANGGVSNPILRNKIPLHIDSKHPLNESLNRDKLRIQWPHISLWENSFYIEVFNEDNARFDVALFDKLDTSKACELRSHRCAIYNDQLVDACSDIGICICKDDYPTALTNMSLIGETRVRDIRGSGR